MPFFIPGVRTVTAIVSNGGMSDRSEGGGRARATVGIGAVAMRIQSSSEKQLEQGVGMRTIIASQRVSSMQVPLGA